jgi:predicted GNAT family N-acyltransferase
LSPNFQIEPLGPNHDRAAFSCGKEALDNYLKTQARKAAEKNLATVFVYTDGTKIAGYYTLSSFTVKLDEIPEALAKKLTKMPVVPATLIGRLARSLEFRGKGIGEILLIDALKKAYKSSKEVASWAVIVDAKDDDAVRFYRKFEFIEFPTVERRMFLSMTSVAGLFDDDDRFDLAPAEAPAAGTIPSPSSS